MAEVARMTRREQYTMETRQLIFDTAIEMFAEEGYDAVTVDEICEKTRVGKSTFYNLFKSKDQIIIEEFLKIDSYYQEIIERIKKKRKSHIEKLLEFMTLTLKYINDMGIEIMKVSYHSQIGPSLKGSPVASPQRALYIILEQAIKEAQEAGEVRTDKSAANIAQNLIMFTRGVIYEWCLKNGGFDLLDAGKEYMDIFIDGIRRHQP
jgi:TetR/AcrR family fatty acid metabolism transcriptional regulator